MTVHLLKPWRAPSGAGYAEGERVTVDDALARKLLEEGTAQPMRAVRLTRTYGTAGGGEVAGYPAPEAEDLIAKGFAEPWPPEPETSGLDAPTADRGPKGPPRSR